MIYRAGEKKTPPGFFRWESGEKTMKKTRSAKTIAVVVAGLALVALTPRANAITAVSPPDSGFDLTSSASSSTDLTQTGGDLFTTSNFSSTTGSGTLGPVSGGPGPVTIQPVPSTGPVIDVPAVPDGGSTAALLGLALLGLAALQRRLRTA